MTEGKGWLFWSLALVSLVVIIAPPPGDELVILPAIWGWYYLRGKG